MFLTFLFSLFRTFLMWFSLITFPTKNGSKKKVKNTETVISISRNGLLKSCARFVIERSECFNLAIFRVRNGFYLVFCRNRDWNGVFLMFLTFFFEPFLVGKVMKENLLRKVRKSEKRKVKNIRKFSFLEKFQ